MMRSMKTRWGIVATVALALTLSAPTTARTLGANNSTTDDCDIGGLLTAVWWQWLYSVPLDESPSFDSTGEYAFENQPFEDLGLIFLAGTYTQVYVGNDIHGTATRSITVDCGTAFFFPLINTEWDNVMFDTPKKGTASVVNNPAHGGLTIPELYAMAASGVEPATDLYCTLTPRGGHAVDVSYQRVISPVFAYYLPEGNIYESYGQTIEGIVYPAVSDGYWAYIAPLPKGRYTLEFGGQSPLSGGTFYEDITYYITVK